MKAVLAASDDGLNGLQWRKRFGQVERCYDLFYELEGVGSDRVPWSELIKGMPYFKCLPSLAFPPCSDLMEFESFEGIHVESRERSCGEAGDFIAYKLYVHEDKIKRVQHEFATLAERLSKWLTERDTPPGLPSALS